MKFSKIKHALASALLVLPLLFSGAQAVSAADTTNAPESYDIQLHKLQFEGKMPDPLEQNTGAELDRFAGVPGLNDVEFTVTDVTDGYYALTGSASERQAAIQAEAAKYASEGKAVTTVTTANNGTEDGIADFNLKTKNSEGKYATYLIQETKSNTTVTDKDGNDTAENGGKTVTEVSAPIVLTMPLNLTAESKNGKVNLYPKNVVINSVEKDLTQAEKDSDGVDTDNNAIVGFGDDVDYSVQATIPSDVASLDTYYLLDSPDKGLDINKDSVKLTDATGADIDPTLYTVESTSATDENGVGFKLTFKNADVAAAGLNGATINVNYSAKVTTILTPGAALTNSVTTPNNTLTPVKSKTPVSTGGAKFVKEDSSNDQKLAGAEFALVKLNNDGTKLYAHKTATGFEWNDQKDGAFTATSDENGAFEFTGLQYSANEEAADKNFKTYAVEEIKAPENYTLLEAPVAFKVSKTSYGENAASMVIKDSPKGFLPSTGGMGIYLVIAAGLAVMAGAFFVLKRGRREEI